eukprot:1408395-Rhodomonas_salina.1
MLPQGKYLGLDGASLLQARYQRRLFPTNLFGPEMRAAFPRSGSVSAGRALWVEPMPADPRVRARVSSDGRQVCVVRCGIRRPDHGLSRHPDPGRR